MDKADEFLQSSNEHRHLLHTLAMCSIPDLYFKDKRVARLLVILRQIHESVGGLAALPKSELREIVSCSVRLCGYVQPVEVREAIASVLEAFEPHDPIPDHPSFAASAPRD
jgi:hypothetical protein